MHAALDRAERDEPLAIAVIHAALDAGATLLDTADAYCHDESDVGHNERLVARALEQWTGDRSTITIATKGGIRRPKGAWINDGRAKHLRDACDASRRALGTDVIDLYQLHAVDPRTPLETSVRALAGLRNEGKIRRVGLCNVTVGQIESARAITEISSVQVEWSVLDDENLRNGVAEYCHDHDIRLIAYRPLGGDRVKRLARDPVLKRIAAKHEATGEEIALAWLMSFDADVVPIPGATRVDDSALPVARPRSHARRGRPRAARRSLLRPAVAGTARQQATARQRGRRSRARDGHAGRREDHRDARARGARLRAAQPRHTRRLTRRSRHSTRHDARCRKSARGPRQHLRDAEVAQRSRRVCVVARRSSPMRVAHDGSRRCTSQRDRSHDRSPRATPHARRHSRTRQARSTVSGADCTISVRAQPRAAA